MKKTQLLLKFCFVLVAALLFSCSPLIGPYDQYAYTQTTSLKVDVLNLIDKSNESYSSHQNDIDDVTSKLMKAIEYEKHRPKNDIIVRMWNKMIDSTKEKGIIGIYLVSWKKKGTQSQTLIDEYKPQVSEAFDMIAELEASKIKSSDANVQNFLNK